jgi:ribosomal protein L10
LKREDKREVVSDLQQRLLRAKVAILTRFSGLNVGRMTQLRRDLRKAGVEYRIIKKHAFPSGDSGVAPGNSVSAPGRTAGGRLE